MGRVFLLGRASVVLVRRVWRLRRQCGRALFAELQTGGRRFDMLVYMAFWKNSPRRNLFVKELVQDLRSNSACLLMRLSQWPKTPAQSRMEANRFVRVLHLRSPGRHRADREFSSG